MADLYEQLKRQALVAATKRTTRRIASVPLRSSATSTIADTPTASTIQATDSQTFVLADCMNIWKYTASTSQGSYPPPWPPDGEIWGNISPALGGATYILPRKDVYVNADQTSYYIVTISGMKWDTASLPDSAIVTRAVVTGTAAGDHFDMERRNLIADWYTWTLSTGDWTPTIATPDALSGVPLASLPASGTFQLELENPTHVSKTGSTYIRLGISGGAPTKRALGGTYGENSYNIFGIRGNYADPVIVQDEVGTHPVSILTPSLGPSLTVYYA